MKQVTIKSFSFFFAFPQFITHTYVDTIKYFEIVNVYKMIGMLFFESVPFVYDVIKTIVFHFKIYIL